MNLTELRKAGLTRACELTEMDPATVVESCFEVWRRARHDVEPHLFPGALETLATLKGRGIRLVAITNGNAQTDDIPCLKDLLEFCVLAEQASSHAKSSKPRNQARNLASERARKRSSFLSIFFSSSSRFFFFWEKQGSFFVGRFVRLFRAI